MRRLTVSIFVLALAGVVLSGCGGGVSQTSRTRERPRISGSTFGERLQPSRLAQAVAVDYHGWKAFKLTNGLVTVVVVPAIGGRIMEYKLGSHPFLWVNPAELGETYPSPATEGERTWHNFGGYKTWPAPETRWGGPPDPLGGRLDGGEWTGRIVRAKGIAEVELVSPEDKNVTGLQIVRNIKLHAGTTRLEVSETFKNISDKPLEWSIWTVTQVPGSLSPKAKFSEQACIYFPLNPQSKSEAGYWLLAEEADKDQQWEKVANDEIVRVSYQGLGGKIGADSAGGWIAYADDLHEYMFVQRFEVEAEAEYPDGGATVEVYTNEGSDSYMEMGVLSPLHALQPGEETSFATNWYATRMSGPPVAVTDVAVARMPVALEQEGQQVWLVGELGVFMPGDLKVVALDGQGREIGEELAQVSARPEQIVSLRQSIDLPAGATTVAVSLANSAGTPVGMVAEVAVDEIVAASG